MTEDDKVVFTHLLMGNSPIDLMTLMWEHMSHHKREDILKEVALLNEDARKDILEDWNVFSDGDYSAIWH